MQEAPVANSLRKPPRRHKGTSVAQEETRLSTKTEEKDPKAEGRTTSVIKARREDPRRNQEDRGASQPPKVRHPQTNVGLHMQHLQQTNKNMVFWLWSTLLLLPIIYTTAGQVPQAKDQQIALEASRQCTAEEKQCPHTLWQDKWAMGTVYTGKGHHIHDSPAQLIFSKGEGQRQERRRTGSRGGQAACAGTDGCRSARRVERSTEEMDQRRTRDHTRRCQKTEEVQEPGWSTQGGVRKPGEDLEGIQGDSKDQLATADGSLPRKEEGPYHAAERSKEEAGRDPERGPGKNGKYRTLRGDSRIRGRGEQRRGSCSPTMGGRTRRRGRGRRGDRRRNDDGRPRKWEKVQIFDAIWRKETPKEGRWKQRKKIEDGGIDKCILHSPKEDWQRPDRRNSRDWAIPNAGPQTNIGGNDEVYYKSIRRGKIEERRHKRKSSGGPTKAEGSQELEELRAMVRQAERQQEEERRLEAEEQLRLPGGEDLGLEILGILAQGEEATPIWIYVLAERHEETIFMRASTTQQGTPHDIVHQILNEVRVRTGHRGYLELVYITPQPPPSWRWEQDALHVIADVQPGRGGSPILMVALFGGSAHEGHPEMEAYRNLEVHTCNTFIRIYGRSERCSERHTTCHCYHRYLEKGLRQAIHVDSGDRVDLRMRYPTYEEEEEDEEEFAFMQKGRRQAAREGRRGEENEDTSLMTARSMRRMRMNTAYAYFFEEDEPRFFAGGHLDKHEYRWHILEVLRNSPTSQGKNYEVYEVKPNPPDLATKGIQGYIVEEGGARSQTQTVILLDVEIIANQEITMDGQRIFTESWRAVERIQERLTRREFLKEVQLSQLCRKSGSCILQMGGKPWREQDPDSWWLFEGTYGLLQILNQKPDIPVSCQTRWAKENLEMEDFEEQWRKEEQERKRRRRNEREEEEDLSWLQKRSSLQKKKERNEENEDDVRHRQQDKRPSDAKQTMARLPPPGNGKVGFKDRIKVCQEGKQKTVRDRAMNNVFIEGMYKGMMKQGHNPFVKGFADGMRYEEYEEEEREKEAEEEKDEEESENEGFLPLMRKEEEEGPIEDDQERKNQKGQQIRLEEMIGGHQDWSHHERNAHTVQQFAEWFNAHHVLPDYDWQRIRWKKETVPWMKLPIWRHSEALELHYYTDGSVRNGKGGSSTVLYVLDKEGWKFGGFLQNTLSSDEGRKITAHMMELEALKMTMKWCHDVIKLQAQDFGGRPKTILHFDAVAAGFSSTGAYGGDLGNPRYVSVRAMEQALELGMGAEIEAQHVRGHSGDPGNEAADVLAEDAINKGKCDGFWKAVETGHWPLQWLWWHYRGDMQKYEKKGEIWIPKPEAEVQEEVIKEIKEARGPRPLRETGDSKEVSLKIMTYNMNTMRHGKEEAQGVGATEAMMEILHKEGVHIAVIQETRINVRLTDCNKRYFYHQEEAKKGKGGILVAVSRELAMDKEGTTFKKDQVRYIGGSEEHIILRFHSAYANFVLVGGHAPHAGLDRRVAEEWWRNLEKEIEAGAKGQDIVTAIDANARVGGMTSEHIGRHQEEGESPNGELFHQYLTSTNQWLPATHEECQVGDGKTMMYPNGTTARLDYVAIPLSWKTYKVKNEIRNDLSNRSSLYDHRPVLLEIGGRMTKREATKPRRSNEKVNLKERKNQERFKEILQKGPRTYPWELDIHTHVARLNTMLRDTIDQVKKEDQTIHKKKSYLAQDTWDAIQDKRRIRKECFEGREEEKKEILRKAFKAWSKQDEDEDEKEEKEVRFGRAKKEEEFRARSRIVTSLVRRDDRNFYDGLAREMKEKEETKESAGLWRCVRRHIPKWKERRKTRDPGKDEGLDQQWEEHMKKIEAAVPREIEEVYARCVERQNGNQQEAQALHKAPTLLEVERALRQAAPGKAPGMDGIPSDLLHYGAKEVSPLVWQVAFKGHQWTAESIQHKGGRLVMLDKKTRSKEAANYRPIMLISAIGRRLHSLLRPQVMEEITKTKKEGQIGGFQGQEAIFGSHYARTLMRIGSATSSSTALMCLDLQTAFHALIRQTTLGDDMNSTTKDEERKAILRNLKGIEANKEEVQRKMDEGPTTEKLGFNRGVSKQLQEISGENWSCLYGHEFQTLKGTRPGSPLADSVFHIAMSEIHGRLQEILDANEHSRRCWEQMSIRCCPITWADDVALMLIAKDPETLMRTIEKTANEASKEFRGHGMTLNYATAKSEVLLSLAGKQAGAERRKLLTEETGEHRVRQEDEKEKVMKTVSVYKHLGTKHQAGGKMNEEVKYRTEQAWAAWRPLSKPIFLNRNLRRETRIDLLQSLVFTRLFFGAGTWPVITRKQTKRIESTMMKMIRGVAGCNYKGQKDHWGDRQVLAWVGLPNVRVRLAKERLTYAKRFFQKVETFMQEAMEIEEMKTMGSWQEGLRKDLKWMHEVEGKWPEGLEETKEAWRTRGGWKEAVKRTVHRHMEQERIALKMQQEMKEKGWTETTEKEEHEGRWTCECGSVHRTKTGLAVHRRQKHGKEGDEYQFGNSSRCLVCLKEFWSVPRLRQHLGYVSRKEKPNWCWKLYKGMDLRGEAEEEEKGREMPQKGINRRENITLQGPKICGAARGDDEWSQRDKDEKEKTMTRALSLEGIEEAFEGYEKELFETWYGEAGLDRVLMGLEESSKSSGLSTLHLATWGCKRKWETDEEAEDWRTTVSECEGGTETLEWVKAQVRDTELKLAGQLIQTKEAKTGRANDKERSAEDGVIVRTLPSLLESLKGRDGCHVLRGAAAKALDKSTRMGALRSLCW